MLMTKYSIVVKMQKVAIHSLLWAAHIHENKHQQFSSACILLLSMHLSKQALHISQYPYNNRSVSLSAESILDAYNNNKPNIHRETFWLILTSRAVWKVLFAAMLNH